MFNKSDAAPKWAAFTICVGLLLLVFNFYHFKSSMPQQDRPIKVEATREIKGSADLDNKLNAVYSTRPAKGSKIGTITFPSLDLSWPIYEGTKEKQLSKGVGHFRGSVLPGMSDNTVLSGHRTTVFKRLGELEINDDILVKTQAGVFVYRVKNFKIVDRSSKKVIVPTAGPVLTLTTCFPFNAIGRTTQAFVVSAQMVESNLHLKGISFIS